MLPELTNHDTRIALLEQQMKHVAPLIELIPLRQQVAELSGAVKNLSETTSHAIEELAAEIRTAFDRLSKLNEEQMRQNAAQAQEKHEAEVREKDAQVINLNKENKRLEEESQSRLASNQIKSWADFVIKLGAAGAVIYSALHVAHIVP